MPKYTPSEDEMDSSYGETPATPTETESRSVDEENQEDSEQTAVLPNKVLSPDGSPLKEGDEVVVKIVKDYGDESEIRCVSRKETKETTEPEMSQEAKELTALDEEGA